MCLYIFIEANSQSFANTGSLVTCVKNFPESHGIVLGLLLKSFVDLNSAIFTQLYYAIYGEDSVSLVLLISWLPAAVSIVFILTIRIMDAKTALSKTSKPFYCFLYISITFAAYLMAVIIVEKQASFSRPGYDIAAAIVVLLFLPLAVVFKKEFKIFKQMKQDRSGLTRRQESRGVFAFRSPARESSSKKQKADDDDTREAASQIGLPPKVARKIC